MESTEFLGHKTIPITTKWFPEKGYLPLMNLNFLTESGAPLNERFTLGYDFKFDAIQLQNEDYETVVIDGIDWCPDLSPSNFNYVLNSKCNDPKVSTIFTVNLVGIMDWYNSTLEALGATVGSDDDKRYTVTKVRFGGHLISAV